MYSKVIDTFEKTESPRRLKPVNVYFHNYCGDKPDGLQSLVTVFDWVQGQSLHSITALQYAKIARDSRFTVLFERSPEHFVMVNEGDLRTYRFPKTEFVPDIARSSGVVGYNEHQGQLYIHTDGRRRVELVFGKDGLVSGHPHLVSSSGEVEWQAFGEGQLEFRVEDVRPVSVSLAGFEAGVSVSLGIDGVAVEFVSDDKGRISLALPPESEVTLLNPSPETLP